MIAARLAVTGAEGYVLWTRSDTDKRAEGMEGRATTRLIGGDR
jgi:hypothetical protein